MRRSGIVPEQRPAKLGSSGCARRRAARCGRTCSDASHRARCGGETGHPPRRRVAEVTARHRHREGDRVPDLLRHRRGVCQSIGAPCETEKNRPEKWESPRTYAAWPGAPKSEEPYRCCRSGNLKSDQQTCSSKLSSSSSATRKDGNWLHHRCLAPRKSPPRSVRSGSTSRRCHSGRRW